MDTWCMQVLPQKLGHTKGKCVSRHFGDQSFRNQTHLDLVGGRHTSTWITGRKSWKLYIGIRALFSGDSPINLGQDQSIWGMRLWFKPSRPLCAGNLIWWHDPLWDPAVYHPMLQPVLSDHQSSRDLDSRPGSQPCSGSRARHECRSANMCALKYIYIILYYI